MEEKSLLRKMMQRRRMWRTWMDKTCTAHGCCRRLVRQSDRDAASAGTGGSFIDFIARMYLA